MNDHVKRELVNRLTKLAQEYGHTEQLRDRIACDVLTAIDAAVAAERERCARIVERINGWMEAREIAAEIRGETQVLAAMKRLEA